jgi:hypothetical protein
VEKPIRGATTYEEINEKRIKKKKKKPFLGFKR